MSNQGQNYARTFAMHRSALIALLEQIPPEKSEFKAWEEGMTFHRLTDHLRGSGERILAMINSQTPGKPEPSSNFVIALERLRNSGDAMQTALSSVSDERFDAVIEAFGGQKMPVSSLVEFAIQHEAHHKGQIWMMARMIGLEPPMFVKIG